MGRPRKGWRASALAGACAVMLLGACGSGGTGESSSREPGPDQVVFEATGTTTANAAGLERAAQILEDRLRAFGVSDVEVSVKGERLVASGTDVTAVAPKVVSTALLEFRPVRALVTPMSRDTPAGDVLANRPGNDQNVKYVVGPAALTGEGVETARAVFIGGNEGWVVNLELSEEGAAAFNQLAQVTYPKAPPENSVAIVLDGAVVSAPAFQTNSFQGGEIQISGDFSEQEAKELATVLRFGALPVQLKIAA